MPRSQVQPKAGGLWNCFLDQRNLDSDLKSHIDLGRLVYCDGWVVIAATRGRIDPKRGYSAVLVGLAMANWRSRSRVNTIPEAPFLSPLTYF